MPNARPQQMTKVGRGILTETEREVISSEVGDELPSGTVLGDNYKYRVDSAVRNRIKARFGDKTDDPNDLDVLAEHRPQEYARLVRLVAAHAGIDEGAVDDALEDVED